MSVLTTRLSRDFKLGVKNLLLHKLRSFLTMLGLVFGVGSVIAMLAIGEGASQEALAQIRKLGSRNILLTAAKPADDDSSGRGHNLSVYGLLYNDVRRLESSFPTVLSAIHDLNMAALYCDRLYVMKQGRILMEGTPEQVLTPEKIYDVYGVRSTVLKNPLTGKLSITFLPEAISA